MNKQNIYSHISVYHDAFDDIDNVIKIVESSEFKNEGSLFKEWVPWYTFGTKCDEFNFNFNRKEIGIYQENTKNILDENMLSERQIEEKKFIEELFYKFWLVLNDYCKDNNLDIEEDWFMMGPSFVKYNPDSGVSKDLAMNYHTDYMDELSDEPGFKFIITCTMYLNDNYEGGDIIFAVEDNSSSVILYKPKRGDFVVFPSGHPDFLTQNGNRYLHGVKSIQNGSKYFVRTYLVRNENGSKEWTDGMEKYGKDEWRNMKDKDIENNRIITRKRISDVLDRKDAPR